jgi:tape measure domain-containing protein
MEPTQTLQLQLTASVDEAVAKVQGAVGNIKGAMEGLQGNLNSGFTGGAGIVQGAVGKITDSLGQLISSVKVASLVVAAEEVNIGKNLLNTAGQIEQSRVSMNTLLGSVPQAGNLMDWLTKLSFQAPVARQKLDEAAQTALAAGLNLDQTKVAIQGVTEATLAAGGSTSKFEAIMTNLGTLLQTPNISMFQLRSLMKEEVPVAQLLTNAINDGALSLGGYGNVSAQAEGATKKMTTAFNSASKENKYLGDQIKITEERLKSATGAKKVHQSTVDSLNLTLRKEQDQLAANKTTIEKYTDATTKIIPAHKNLLTSFADLTATQQKEFLQMNSGKDIALALATEENKLYGGMGAMAAQAQTLPGLITIAGNAFTQLFVRLIGLNNGMVQSGGAFDILRKAVGSVIDFLTSHQDQIVNFFNNLLKNKDVLIMLAGIILGPLIIAFTSWVAPIMLVSAIFGGLTDLVFHLVGGFEGLKAIMEKVTPVFNAIGGAAKFAVQHIDYIKGALLGLIPAFIALAAINIGPILLSIGGALITLLYPIGAVIAAIGWIPLAIAGAGVLIGVATVAIIKHWSSIVTFFTVTLPKVFKEVVSAAVSFGSQLINNVVTAISRFSGQVGASVYKLVNDIAT